MDSVGVRSGSRKLIASDCRDMKNGKWFAEL